MTKWRSIVLNLVAGLLLMVPCGAAVINTISVPATRASGDNITATIWNNDVLGIYSYINNTLVPVLNLLTARGDTYAYSGSALVKVAVGADGTVFTADSTQTAGVKWAALANTAQLTTKGDLLGYSSTAARVPIGADGTVLVADSTQALGLKWGTPTTNIPKGTIVAWSPAGAGTSTIPSGWALCDGGTYSGVVTPNLIGKFVIGGRPSGSSSAAATGGYGIETVDANGTGTATHTHTVSLTGTTGAPSASVAVQEGSDGTKLAGTNGHTHAFTASGSTGATSTEPADYALVYIEKL
jgi:hypothetical protein